MAYIRVTSGPDLGNSPGSPYVMEIWPAQCRSPIHDHSSAVGVIKVLHGSIRSTWFNPLAMTDNAVPEPIATATFSAGDITYLTPSLWQTHQLENPLDFACITIQTYQYPEEDEVHYETFDYLDGVKNEGDRMFFEPDSDYQYLELMKLLDGIDVEQDSQGIYHISRLSYGLS